HMEDIIVLLVRHVEEEAACERMCVVMFDDAHLLAHTAVSLVMRLVSESALRVVMFAETTLMTHVNQAAKKYEVEWFEIRLSGFPVQDVRDYLEWRFAQAHYRGRLPFTNAQVAKISERSGGNPNVIDFMANELLADLETGQVRELGGGFPQKHTLLVAILAVLVFLIYQLYLQPALEEGDPNDILMIENGAVARDGGGAQQAEKATAFAAIEIEATESLPEGQRQSAIEGIDMAGVIAEAAPSTGSKTTAEVGTAEESVIVDAPIAAPSVEPVDSDTLSEAGPRPIPNQNMQPEKRVTAIRESPIPVADAVLKGNDFPTTINGPRWLRDQNGLNYTLQLMTLSRPRGGVDLIKRQRDSAEFAMYPLRRNGKTMYVVTYGVFSNRAAAQRAASRLTGELAGVQPWIRTFALVQDAISD
ncbi:MAG: SPOR domain-containing protein, partial [Pseudomonadales bacterium]|nr:SPOR domain-containing protein [Pseudomonadales bacterium]